MHMAALLKRPRFLAVLLVLALLLAGVIQFAASARRVEAAPVAAQTPLAALAVITAATDLPPGHIIRAGDLAELVWPQAEPPPGAIIAGSAAARAVVGAVSRRALATGELLQPAAVIRPGEHGFLAALVAPGNRAIAIAVDATSSASGLIWPGDRVDVILTQELRDDAVPLAQRVLAETILADVRVLSADQRLATASGSDSSSGAGVLAGDAAKPGVPATVTLEVTPAQAERVTVAATLGRLHLTLRGVESEAAAPVAAMWAGTVSPGLTNIRRTPPASLSAAPVSPAGQPVARAGIGGSVGVRIYRGSGEVTK